MISKDTYTHQMLFKVDWKQFLDSDFFTRYFNMNREVLANGAEMPECLSADPLPKKPSIQEIQNADSDALQAFAALGSEAHTLVAQEFKRRSSLLVLNCLKRFLVDDEDAITMERFGKIIDIFGPIKHGIDMLERILTMMEQPWFHGDMTKDEAFELLKQKSVGSFLVRFSSTKSEFVISAVIKKQVNTVVHFRISHDIDIGFTIPGSEPADDLYKLLQQNSHRFKHAQAPEQTKYKYLLNFPSLRDGGYYDEKDLQW